MKFLVVSALGVSGTFLRVPAPGPGPSPAPGPSDSLLDEVIDQANPEFKLADFSGNHCVEIGEFMAHIDEMVHARKDVTTQNCPKFDKALDDVSQALHKVFIKHGFSLTSCLDKAKYHEAAQDFRAFVGGATLCQEQFILMDRNCDDKVSKQEFWTFADEYMTHADISHGLATRIWDAVNGRAVTGAPAAAAFLQGSVPGPAPAVAQLVSPPDRTHMFVTMREFCEAGPKFSGDGPGK
jgi:hypothetical protein